MSPLVVLRADASATMGAGHVMRSMALGQAWREMGGAVVLAYHECPDGMLARASEAGFGLRKIDVAPGELAAALSDLRPDWVSFDGYSFDGSLRDAARRDGTRALVIDDGGRTGPGWADAILDQNLGATAAPYLWTTAIRMLGSRYALLRPEFVRAVPREVSREAQRVLITFGGADADDMTTLAMRAVATCAGLDADIVVGGANARFDGIVATARSLGAHFRVHRNVGDMSELMRASDIAITAGGTTLWELARLGVPALTIIAADNQRAGTQACAAAGTLRVVGDCADASVERLVDEIRALVANVDLRRTMSASGRSLVDGGGAARVVARMRAPVIALRPLDRDDAERLFSWSNEPAVRSQSFDTRPIEWSSHVRWLEALLTSPTKPAWIGLVGGAPIGVIRFQVEGTDATVGVSVDAQARGHGLGSALIDAGSRALFAATSVQIIRAHIKASNTASQRAFTNAGYTLAPSELGTTPETGALTLVRSSLS